MFRGSLTSPQRRQQASTTETSTSGSLKGNSQQCFWIVHGEKINAGSLDLRILLSVC